MSVTNNSVLPIVANLNQLLSLLSEYYSGKTLLDVKNLILSETPWSILSVLYTPNSFHLGFKNGAFKCQNGHIKWHLARVTWAIIRSSLTLPTDAEVPPFFVMYDLDSTRDQICGQGKLYFTLTLFISECIKKGYLKAYEVGSGPDIGGAHHSEVAKLVPKPFILNMNDPLAKEKTLQVGNVTMNITGACTSLSATFDAPVYSDVYDDHGWDELQNSLKAPFVMKKRVFDSYGSKRGVILQPFHREVRELPGFKHLVPILESVSSNSRCFCSCRDCVLLKSLCSVCKLDEATVLMSLISLGYKPHVYVPGFNSILHRINADGGLVDQCVRVSQGVSIVDNGHEVFGNFTPVPVRKKKLRDPKHRREVLTGNLARYRLDNLTSRLHLTFEEFGEFIHYGRVHKPDYPWRIFVPNKDMAPGTIFASVPWTTDLLPLIDRVPTGQGLSVFFPMTQQVARNLELRLAECGFAVDTKETGVKDTYMLFIRVCDGKCAFTFPGTRPLVKFKEGGFNPWGNGQTTQITKAFIYASLALGDRTALDVARRYAPGNVNRAPFKKVVNSQLYAMERDGFVKHTPGSPPTWECTPPPPLVEGCFNPYGNCQQSKPLCTLETIDDVLFDKEVKRTYISKKEFDAAAARITYLNNLDGVKPGEKRPSFVPPIGKPWRYKKGDLTSGVTGNTPEETRKLRNRNKMRRYRHRIACGLNDLNMPLYHSVAERWVDKE
jgi:hypothetical protein